MTNEQACTAFNIPSFNLRQLTYFQFWALSGIAAMEVDDDLRDLSKMAKKIGSSRKGKLAVISYVAAAYEKALAWEEEGATAELILGATFVTDRLAFRKEIDLFTAVLKLGIKDARGKFPLRRSADACKFAWVSHWNLDQFEYELLCEGISGVANRWREVSSVAKLDGSAADPGKRLVATS